jgi:hypothetical protein
MYNFPIDAQTSIFPSVVVQSIQPNLTADEKTPESV